MKPINLALAFALGLGAAIWSPRAHAKTVHYELTATRGEANLSGKQTVDWALMINGGA